GNFERKICFLCLLVWLLHKNLTSSVAYYNSKMSKKILRKIIVTDLAPKPVAPYNQAVVIDNTIYLSGVVGVDPRTNKLVDGGTAAEAKQALLNMKQILSVANSKMGNVVKTTVLLADIGDFAGVNEVYKERK
ncbi:Ribonuclease UK114, partial [Blattella germanica]